MAFGDMAFHQALRLYEKAVRKKEAGDPSAFSDFLGLEEFVARCMRDENSRLSRERLYTIFEKARKEHKDIVQEYVLQVCNPQNTGAANEGAPSRRRENPMGEEDDSWIASLKMERNIRMKDVVGLEKQKEYLMALFVYPFESRETEPLGGGTVLLYGPPGTGKTFLVRALAGEKENGSVYNVRIGDVLSKYYGESSRRISQVFRNTKREDILYFDEIDALFGESSREFDASSRTLATLLSEMDGATGSSPSVIGSTNRPDLMDPAALDRFETKMYVPPPDIDAKMGILETEASRYGGLASIDVDWDLVREEILSREIDTVYNARSMRNISNKARVLAMRDFFSERKKEFPIVIETGHYIEAIHETRPSIPRGMIRYYENLDL